MNFHISKRSLMYVFFATLVIQFVGSIFYFFFLTNAVWVQPVYGATKVIMFLAPLVLMQLAFPLPSFKIAKHPIRAILTGLVSGIIMSGFIYLTFYLLRSQFLPLAVNIARKVDDIGIASYYLLFAIALSIIHSLFEEYFWRWYAIGGLANYFSKQMAIFCGAIFFSLHHFVILSQFFPITWTLLFGIAVGIGGIIWSYLYKYSNSLLTPWISHAIVDGTLFFIGYILLGSI
ncbi:CPBP family intramembrane metalloprotease [Patescibacteria group bacterium]|nr:CPBP family intramembrane metalloprotease [Patescibacteria group bacterium]MBU4453325.1 CPBP family intramembrane metalloprotease [Patescibacteria group bacterium]